MVSRLIFYECELCGIMYKIHIGNHGVAITILDKLHSERQILDNDGFLICIQCKHKNNLQIQRIFP